MVEVKEEMTDMKGEMTAVKGEMAIMNSKIDNLTEKVDKTININLAQILNGQTLMRTELKELMAKNDLEDEDFVW